jgi:hypothetical protein
MRRGILRRWNRVDEGYGVIDSWKATVFEKLAGHG